MLLVLFILFLSGLEHQCIHTSAVWFCRITGWLMLEGTSGGDLVQSPAQAGPPRADYWGPSPGGFWVSSFFVIVLAVCLYILSLRRVILVSWRGKDQCLCLFPGHCSVVLSYSLESSLKISNITVRKKMAMRRTLLVLSLKMLDLSCIFLN